MLARKTPKLTPCPDQPEVGTRQPTLCPSRTIFLEPSPNLAPSQSPASGRQGFAMWGHDAKITKIGVIPAGDSPGQGKANDSQPTPEGQESIAQRATTQAHQHSTAQAEHRKRNDPEPAQSPEPTGNTRKPAPPAGRKNKKRRQGTKAQHHTAAHKKRGGGGNKTPRPRAPEAEKHVKQETTGRTEGGRERKKEGGGQDAKAQGTRGRKTRKAGHNGGSTKGRRGKETKKPNNNHKQGNPSAQGAEQAKSEPRTAKGKVRHTKTRPEGRPARHGQAGHAHAHTRGTRAWRPPTRKGRCRRPHKIAPVHRPSPPSQDRRYGKPDASVTGSTHAKPPQRTQPKNEAGGTRQRQPNRGAPNGYDAERAQRSCLGRGQRQAQ